MSRTLKLSMNEPETQPEPEPEPEPGPEPPDLNLLMTVGIGGWLTGMEQVIKATFSSITDRPLPPELTSKLLHRFSSGEGYSLTEQSVGLLLREIKAAWAARDGDGDGDGAGIGKRVMIGVVTNSDDRVPGVLDGLGVRVGSGRWPLGFSPPFSSEERADIDFCCLSYDVGAAKPDKKIFEAAEDMARGLSSSPLGTGETVEDDWLRVYVGDEFKKDVQGALGAGWNAVLLEGGHDTTPEGLPKGEAAMYGLERLDETKRVDELFKDGKDPRAVSVGGLDVLLKWLARG